MYVECVCQPELCGGRAANSEDSAGIPLPKLAIFFLLTSDHRTGVGKRFTPSTTKRIRGETPYHIGVLYGLVHRIKPARTGPAITIKHDRKVKMRVSERKTLSNVPSVNTGKVDHTSIMIVRVGRGHLANGDQVLPGLNVGFQICWK